MAHEDPQALLKTAIHAAQQKNTSAAREMLERVVVQDPRNELAWIWLATIADTPAEQRACLMHVLDINPNNQRAQQMLNKPGSSGTPSAPAASPGPKRVSERQRRRMPLLFFALVTLAVAMVTVGVLLLADSLRDDEASEASATPAAAAGLGATPTGLTPQPTGETATAIPTSRIGTGEAEPLPPTWTPTATWTPSPSPEPTAAPPSLADYTLLISQRANETNWELATLRADGSRADTLTFRSPEDLLGEGTDDELVALYDASYSPDGAALVVVGTIQEAGETDSLGNPVEYTELFLAPAAGGDLRPLTSLRAEQTVDPAWSPDGSQIVFASNADQDFDVYTIDVEEDEPRRLTDNSGDDRYPAWSPDGASIAYASDEAGPGTYEIWRLPATGGSPDQLTDAANNSFSPAYSPDGQWIAFVSDRGGDGDLYLMNADGTGERLLTMNDDYAAYDPAWSPDGEWIAYSSDWDSYFDQLCVIRPDGSNFQRVTDDEINRRYAAWTP